VWSPAKATASISNRFNAESADSIYTFCRKRLGLLRVLRSGQEPNTSGFTLTLVARKKQGEDEA